MKLILSCDLFAEGVKLFLWFLYQLVMGLEVRFSSWEPFALWQYSAELRMEELWVQIGPSSLGFLCIKWTFLLPPSASTSPSIVTRPGMEGVTSLADQKISVPCHVELAVWSTSRITWTQYLCGSYWKISLILPAERRNKKRREIAAVLAVLSSQGESLKLLGSVHRLRRRLIQEVAEIWPESKPGEGV